MIDNNIYKKQNMIIKDIYISGFKNAMIGMRYSHNSEKLSDSTNDYIGSKDLELLKKLTKAGKDHRKALRMIQIWMSIKMPIYWWSQFDTYKIGTTANSRSKMHTFGQRLLTLEDFTYPEHEKKFYEKIIKFLNIKLKEYQKTKNNKLWKFLISILPMSYNQERMVNLNYEVLLNIINARLHHKLEEWEFFCNTMLKVIPYLKELYEMTR